MTLTDKMPTQKPHLLIIELNYHAEVLNAICPVLAERFFVSIWTTEKIWGKMDVDRALFNKTLITPNSMTPKHYWKQHIKKIDNFDLVYFNTLERYFPVFNTITFTCPTIVRIHNTNASLFPKESIEVNFRDLPKIIFFIIRRLTTPNSWLAQKTFYKKMSLLMLPSTAIRKAMELRLEAYGYHNISDYCLPFFSIGEASPVVEALEVTFAITGSVDPKRKEYQPVFSALQALKNQHPNTKLRMLLLGPPIGKPGLAVIDQFKNLEDRQFTLEYFLEYVPTDIMAHKMQSVQFLIAPIRLKTKYKIYTEYYGKSKVSGVENDAVYFRKPVILPSEYSLPDDLKPIGYPYRNSEDLLKQLNNLGIQKKYKDAKTEFERLTNYQKGTIAENFYRLYQKTLINNQPTAVQ